MNRSILLEQMSGEQILARFDILEAQLKNLQAHPSTAPAPGYLNRQDVAKLLGVSGVTVWDWTNKGFLKAYRLGNKVFYKAAEIDAAMVEIQKGGRRNGKG